MKTLLSLSFILLLSIIFPLDLYSTVVSYNIISSLDDAEQDGSNSNNTGSSTLNMNDNDYIGIRFQNVAIPNGATINSTTIRFKQRNRNDSGTLNVTIYGEDIDDASNYSSTRLDQRTKTSANVVWTESNTWSRYESGVDTTTDDISTIVQEIVNRAGWASGNSLSFLFEKLSGNDRRPGSYDRGSSYAAYIEIDFTQVLGADLSLTENTIPNPTHADINEDVNITIHLDNLGTLDAESNITLNVIYNQDVNITSASEINANDFNCSQTTGALTAGTPIVCTMDSNLTNGSSKNFSFVVQASILGDLIQTSTIASQTSDTNAANNTLVSTTVPIVTPTYCEKYSLSQGFHMIDPDGGSEKNSFEVFCYEDVDNYWLDLIALPIKNDSNNFLFTNDATSSNYYDTTANPRIHFHAISINANSITYTGFLGDGVTPRPLIPVVVPSASEPYSITTDGNSYKLMRSSFSNINLTGTPFIIDWDNTNALGGCDETKLRKALGQAVKYNTINITTTSNDGQSRCEISTMKLSLLDDYQYLEYGGSEVLQYSCKEMANYVPSNILLDSSIDGHFNILTSATAYPTGTPTTNGTRDNGQDIGATLRPLTVYCKYQTDLSFVWTFLTALDGEVTQYKTDLVNKSDTCSQLGLLFYVPNSKVTFNRVREYLLDKKVGDSGWENYTGTIEEKIQALHSGNIYYLPEFKDVLIWPYGPLGVYFPYSGNHDKDGASLTWNNTSNMSFSPMHNISTEVNYNSSMGNRGWVSILSSNDLNKTEDWWISDIGAGEEITKTASNHTYSPSGTHPNRSSNYYEPNGNYSQYAWLNFLYDEDGWVYHNDDWNANYPYYDYMCMSETNYDTASRYVLIPGFYNAIERSTRVGNTAPNFSDENITTKIVSKPMQLDILLYKLDASTLGYDKSQLETDQNKSVGVFIASADENATTTLVKFIGEYEDFDTTDGRIELPDLTITDATKRMFIQFYYCDTADTNWRICWNYNDVADSPIVLELNATDAGKLDSVDDFAVRPKEFSIVSSTGSTTVKATDVNLSYYAYNYLDAPSNSYNELFSTLDINTSLADPAKEANCTNDILSLNLPVQFINGVEHNVTTLGNVGVYNIAINEVNGTEFAVVDADDTPDIDRYITPSDINLTILPDHFTITPITQINATNNFTYLSSDLDNMALKFDFNVTAQNSADVTTGNYASGCYANNINVDMNYTVTNGAMPDLIIYKELNTSIEGNNSATDNLFLLPKVVGDILPSTLFTTDNNGTAELSIRVNFQRDVNNSLNPFIVKFGDLNVSDQSSALSIGTDSSRTINQDAKMIYGRTNAPRYRFTTVNGNAFIYYETFCNATDSSGTTCDKTLLPNGSDSNSTDDPRWFLNTSHTSVAGVAGNVNQKGFALGVGSVTETATNNNNPTQSSLNYNASATKGYPYKTTMENNASGWLIYNKYDSTDTTNEFEVEFEGGNGDWVGNSETNVTTIKNGANKTNRRSMW